MLILSSKYLWTFLSLFCGIKLIPILCQDNSNLEDVEINTASTTYTIKVTLNEDDTDYTLLNVTCINGKNDEIVANEHHVCENLDPCTNYKVIAIIHLRNETHDQEFSKTTEARTEYIEPVVAFKDIIASIDYINISWTAEDEACISEYIVEVISTDKVLHYELSDKKETQVKGVKPCLDYNITLEVVDVNDKKLSKLKRSVMTEYAEPGDIEVQFSDENNGRQKVNWESPDYRTCISAYHLKWSIMDCLYRKSRQIISTNDLHLNNESSMMPVADDQNCAWSVTILDPNLEEYVINGLQGCEDYKFQILINQNATPKATSYFHSSDQVPTEIVGQNLKIGENNITVNWDPPESHRKCVKNYTVTILGPLQDEPKLMQKNSSETVQVFDDLCPCGEYNLSISFETFDGSKGPDLKSTFKTNEGKPTAVQNFQIFPNAKELTFTWEAPAFAHLCVMEYRITGWTDVNIQDFEKITNETSATISELSSCQPYTIQIIPTTFSQNDGAPKQMETSTSAIKAKPPNTLNVVGSYPNRLELSAHDLDVDNNCETISAKFFCSLLFDDSSIRYKSAEQYVNDGQLGGILFQATLSPLSPNANYVCHVSLLNIAGWSNNRTMVESTQPYFPERPIAIDLQLSSSTSLSFVWSMPSRTNGIINLYKTYFQMYEPAYFVPPSCTYEKTKPDARETSDLKQPFSNLQPYTKYSFQVAAQNQYGIGEYTRPYIVITKPAAAEEVMNVKSVSYGPELSDSEYKASVLVSFMAPCKSNGIIEKIRISFSGDRTSYSHQNFNRYLNPDFNEDGYMTYNETNLKPEYNYTVLVDIKTTDINQWSPAAKSTFDSPAGIPKIPDEDVLNDAKVNPFDTNNPTRTAVVRFPRSILESEEGSIIYMALLISEKECVPNPQLRYGAINAADEWPDSLSWSDVYKNNENKCVYQYQTTPSHWIPGSSASTKMLRTNNYSPKENEIVYIIGEENCDQVQDKYCNGPLQPDTEYNLVFRLFTKSGYRDSYLVEFKTDSLIQVSLILFSVCGCLLVAFVAGIIYLWVTKRIQWKRQSYHDIGDSFGDMMPKNFATYYQDITRPEKIAREFKELSGVAMDLSFSASEMGYTKNRYADIFPYDKNRVILDIDAEGSDYINASFIDGYNRKKEYIATQGPKPESILDFWRMILQYNVRVIVMVTQFKEDNVVKCHTYYPFNSKGISVVVKKLESFELYDRREINVTHEKYGLKQKVMHYFFKKWPDRSVPTDPNHLITFVKKVKSEKVPRYSPIVVHCSAGVGRTGTFIGLDILMQRLKNESKINIYETVKKLRFQRMKMVQTIAQYSFLYSCTYELVKHKKQKQNFANKTKTGKSVCFQDMAELKLEIPSNSQPQKATDYEPESEMEMYQKDTIAQS